MSGSEVAVFRASAGSGGDNGFDAFREHIGRTILRLEMTPVGEAPLYCDVTIRAMPDVAVASGALSPMTSHHPEVLGDDAVVLAAVRSGRAELRYQGNAVRVADGDAVLTANDETGTFTGHTETWLTNIRLDRRVLGRYLTDPQAAIGQPIPASHSALRLLLSYADVLADTQLMAGAEARRVFSANMYDLAALVLGGGRNLAAHAGGVRAARLHAVKADMEQRFREPLTIGEMARAHEISASYLRQLFAGAGTSFADTLMELRLAAVHRALISPHTSHLAISDIAYDAGFGDLSYFNRAFRRRYGMTPSEARATR
ncbi:MAG: AraC family transcriptional regulator [Devosia sp.]